MRLPGRDVRSAQDAIDLKMRVAQVSGAPRYAMGASRSTSRATLFLVKSERSYAEGVAAPERSGDPKKNRGNVIEMKRRDGALPDERRLVQLGWSVLAWLKGF
jgi:hypothetical protein